jgi:hypothetical protein
MLDDFDNLGIADGEPDAEDVDTAATTASEASQVPFQSEVTIVTHLASEFVPE